MTPIIAVASINLPSPALAIAGPQAQEHVL